MPVQDSVQPVRVENSFPGVIRDTWSCKQMQGTVMLVRAVLILSV